MKEVFKDPILFFIALSIVLACTSIGNSIIVALIYLFSDSLILFKDGSTAFRRKPIILFMGFVLIVIFYSAFGKGIMNAETYRMCLFSFISLFSVFIISYHLKTLNNNQIKGLLQVVFVAFLFSIIGSTVVSFINPMAVRTYGFGEVEGVDLELASRYYSMGMMSYSLAHAMSVAAVGLSVLIFFAHNRWIKILSFVMLLLIIRLLFIMTITTSLLLTALGVSIVIANHFSHGKTAVAVLMTVALFLIFFLTGFAALFLDFTGNTNTDISRKLADVITLAETGVGSGQVGYRVELYRASFNTFLSNPLFGWGSDYGTRQFIGEHSYLLDYLAYFGLFAILLFVSFWKEYISLKPWLPKSLRNYYYCCFIPVAGLLAMKGRSVCGALPYMSLVVIQLVFLYISGFSNER